MEGCQKREQLNAVEEAVKYSDAVIQVSDRNAAYWEPDSAIEDPYIPKVKGGIK